MRALSPNPKYIRASLVYLLTPPNYRGVEQPDREASPVLYNEMVGVSDSADHYLKYPWLPRVVRIYQSQVIQSPR
jgi:hypothetical protein